MRPCSVYANPTGAAGCPCDILGSLYGPTVWACAWS
jgi:hypothetical protein